MLLAMRPTMVGPEFCPCFPAWRMILVNMWDPTEICVSRSTVIRIGWNAFRKALVFPFMLLTTTIIGEYDRRMTRVGYPMYGRFGKGIEDPSPRFS